MQTFILLTSSFHVIFGLLLNAVAKVGLSKQP